MKNYNTTRCYHSHPALPLKDGLVVYGGSCIDPAVLDADVYVGFDYGMRDDARAYPWNDGVWFQYLITDMKAPKNPESFSQLIDWLILQLSANKKVHLGCIGGHGRTGTVLAALVARFMGVKDAIQYVRKNYCDKAVESKEQIDFLMKHFGVSSADPSKSHAVYAPAARSNAVGSSGGPSPVGTPYQRTFLPPESQKTTAKMVLKKPALETTPVPGVPSLWVASASVRK